MSLTNEEVVQWLGNQSVLTVIALTKELEEKWGVKAVPPVVQLSNQPGQNNQAPTQTEFTVVLASVPADKKMAVIKLVREALVLGLKESKELVEAAPKNLGDNLSKEQAEELKNKFIAAGAVIEVK